VRIEDVYIRGTGVRLPARLMVQDAVASGECDPKLVARTGAVSVCVSAGESAAEMAAHAARDALSRAGSTPGDVELILHADTYHQGQDLWPVASYIQRETVRNQCLAVEIRQMSNGGLAALDLACAYLRRTEHRTDALLTAADRFCPPGIDRWRTDPGTPYADGAAAVVLSRRGGFARLLSVAVNADSELEEMHRGQEPFSPAPLSIRTPVDFDAAKRYFTSCYGLSFAISRTTAGQRAAVKQALADAQLELEEAQWVILPHFGRRRLESIYLQQYGIPIERTTWEWSRTVGHLGAADQFASLDHLVSSGAARPGDHCVLISVGAGYSWGAAVLRITERPAWCAEAEGEQGAAPVQRGIQESSSSPAHHEPPMANPTVEKAKVAR